MEGIVVFLTLLKIFAIAVEPFALIGCEFGEGLLEGDDAILEEVDIRKQVLGTYLVCRELIHAMHVSETLEGSLLGCVLKWCAVIRRNSTMLTRMLHITMPWN